MAEEGRCAHERLSDGGPTRSASACGSDRRHALGRGAEEDRGGEEGGHREYGSCVSIASSSWTRHHHATECKCRASRGCQPYPTAGCNPAECPAVRWNVDRDGRPIGIDAYGDRDKGATGNNLQCLPSTCRLRHWP